MGIAEINAAMEKPRESKKGRKDKGTMAFSYDIREGSESKERDAAILSKLDALVDQTKMPLSEVIKNLIEEGVNQFFQ